MWPKFDSKLQTKVKRHSHLISSFGSNIFRKFWNFGLWKVLIGSSLIKLELFALTETTKKYIINQQVHRIPNKN